MALIITPMQCKQILLALFLDLHLDRLPTVHQASTHTHILHRPQTSVRCRPTATCIQSCQSPSPQGSRPRLALAHGCSQHQTPTLSSPTAMQSAWVHRPCQALVPPLHLGRRCRCLTRTLLPLLYPLSQQATSIRQQFLQQLRPQQQQPPVRTPLPARVGL